MITLTLNMKENWITNNITKPIDNLIAVQKEKHNQFKWWSLKGIMSGLILIILIDINFVLKILGNLFSFINMIISKFIGK